VDPQHTDGAGLSGGRAFRRAALSGGQRFPAAGAQHVQAHPADDRGQPSDQVPDGTGVGAAEPQPRFLDGVVGVAQRAEHPVGQRLQVAPVRFELARQELVIAHGRTLPSRPVRALTDRTRPM
jgi:hypothetical protein